jgi:hypothetical protein
MKIKLDENLPEALLREVGGPLLLGPVARMQGAAGGSLGASLHKVKKEGRRFPACPWFKSAQSSQRKLSASCQMPMLIAMLAPSPRIARMGRNGLPLLIAECSAARTKNVVFWPGTTQLCLA